MVTGTQPEEGGSARRPRQRVARRSAGPSQGATSRRDRASRARSRSGRNGRGSAPPRTRRSIREPRASLKADKLVDPHALGTSIDGDRVELSRRDAVARGDARRMPDDDRGAVDLVHSLEAACEVHGVAEGRVVQPRRRPDIAHDRGTGFDADADAQLVGRHRVEARSGRRRRRWQAPRHRRAAPARRRDAARPRTP